VKRDFAWFERNYAADASEIDGKAGAINDKTKAIAMMKADKSGFESAELSEMDIRIEGGTAVITGINRVKGRDEKTQSFDIRVRFTDTFVKRDGRWHIWTTQVTRIP
jgi:ketosteroid isomerase-like protein